ncbi:ubiquitin-conjugating enzyme E2 S [Diaphorina citri]|uniref:Ubiquitin-conjugating enzyme E2 S n=1 Tax=Diaphorina citri TaxID=121845 RepID=A0A1S3D3Z7_DIACI|nr:ubiquitin-conjugating enzyme E2 S [Diaphorina citri]
MNSMSNVENLSPQIIRRVSKELQDLTKTPPEGIHVCINEEDITDVQAIIDGPAGTPYSNGYFKVKLLLSKNFPSVPPKAFFLTKIFHPNVDTKNGEICVNTLKKDWNPDLGIKHILLTIKCLLIVPNPESALNEEAGKLLLEHYDDYSRRATMMTEIHAQASKCSKLGYKSSESRQSNIENQHSGNTSQGHAGSTSSSSVSGSDSRQSRIIQHQKESCRCY